MASTRTTNNLNTRVYTKMFDFDPDATTATDIGWVSTAGYLTYVFGFFRTIGTSDLTMTILGNTTATGTGTDVTLKSKTLTSIQPNAVADQVYIEIGQDEIAQLAAENGVDIKGISLNLTFATATDEGVALYLFEPDKLGSAVTVDIVA